MLVLYDSAVSGNCYKVRLLLAHLKIPYERRELSVTDRSNRPELLGSLNPALRVPTIVLDDGRALAESNAILWYFGDGTAYVPTDRYERAQVLQWQFFEQYEHEPNIAVARNGCATRTEAYDRPRSRSPDQRLQGARCDGESISRGASSWSGRASRWRTSRCTPTRTSRMKAAST